MYNTRLNEDAYEFALTVRRLPKFYIGERVVYSGRTNYSYYEGKEPMKFAKNERGTIVSVSNNNVVVKLDDYRKPYRTTSTIPYMDSVDVLPIHQYAVVTEGNLACGEQTLKDIYD